MKFSLPSSPVLAGLEWLGKRIPYPDDTIKGDTFPMTWADDDEIYTSAGDPLWGESRSGLDIEKLSGAAPAYTITKVNPMNDYLGWGGDGPKPSGMICVGGILYLAFQNMLKTRRPPHSLVSQHGSDAQIIYSTNKGAFWVPSLANISAPMFPGHKFGGPTFVQYGKDNAQARDGYVYAVSSDQWDNGSSLRLGRVSADRIMDRAAWEFVCAFDPSGGPAWHADLDEAVPVLSLHRWIGLPEMVYLSGIRRYLLLTWRLHADFSPDAGTDLLVLDAPEPWGPFSLVYFEPFWQGKKFNPYCPRLPLKWMEPDGLTGWMQFSGSWGKYGQQANYYRSNLRQFRLKLHPAPGSVQESANLH